MRTMQIAFGTCGGCKNLSKETFSSYGNLPVYFQFLGNWHVVVKLLLIFGMVLFCTNGSICTKRYFCFRSDGFILLMKELRKDDRSERELELEFLLRNFHLFSQTFRI